MSSRGAVAGLVVVLGVVCGYYLYTKRNISKVSHIPKKGGFWHLVGNTPLVRIDSLSDEYGVEILGKCEFLNPGGSVKDRVACSIILEAEKSGKLRPGATIYEGTSGSTGISLTLAAQSRGYKSVIFMPNDQSVEKISMLKALGADVRVCPPVSAVDPSHYSNAASAAASRDTNGFFADQFESPANFFAHFHGTGKEIYQQTNKKINCFVASAGTGGTISGAGYCLKTLNPNVKVILADPAGSSLHGRVEIGVLFTPEDKETHRPRLVFDTIAEGVGTNRMSANFKMGVDLNVIDHSFKVADTEAVEMSRFICQKDGLFLGSSSAVNLCGVVKAVNMGLVKKGDVVVTILCDSGMRHLSRFFNSSALQSIGILPAYLATNLEPTAVEPHRHYYSGGQADVSNDFRQARLNSAKQPLCSSEFVM